MKNERVTIQRLNALAWWVSLDEKKRILFYAHNDRHVIERPVYVGACSRVCNVQHTPEIVDLLWFLWCD